MIRAPNLTSECFAGAAEVVAFVVLGAYLVGTQPVAAIVVEYPHLCL